MFSMTGLNIENTDKEICSPIYNDFGMHKTTNKSDPSTHFYLTRIKTTDSKGSRHKYSWCKGQFGYMCPFELTIILSDRNLVSKLFFFQHLIFCKENMHGTSKAMATILLHTETFDIFKINSVCS